MKDFWHYMIGNKKPVLFIQIMLFLVGVILIDKGSIVTDSVNNTIMLSIGITFSAGAVVSVLDLISSTLDTISNNKVSGIIESGIDQLYWHRDLEEYYQKIKNASNIDICGYSLRGFMQSHKTTILNLAKKKDFQMRIVLVNPDSEVSKNREKLEEEVEGEYNKQCKDIISEFGHNSRISIYYVDFALSTMIFRIDDVMYVGPHFIKSASKSSFTMKLKKESRAFKEFQEEFDIMCDKGNCKNNS